MARKKKKDEIPTTIEGGVGFLLKKLEIASKARATMRATDVSATWRYIDFTDVSKNRPCLPLEYLYGTRGLICGRIVKYNAVHAAGKSASIFMNYAMGQRQGVWATHLESEETPPPPDFQRHLGCNPKELIVQFPHNVSNCLDEAETFIRTVRESLDPDKKHPIIVGIDSVSGLASKTLNPSAAEKKEENKQGKVAFHSRAFSEFFREKLPMFKEYDAVMVSSGQLKADIGAASVFGAKGPQQTSLADAPFSYHASWTVEITHGKWWVEGVGDIGETITCRTTKNKLASRGRMIKIHLLKPELAGGDVGWDFTEAHKTLFLKAKPFDEDTYTNSGGWHKHPKLNGGKSVQNFTEFLDLMYDNEEVLMECRRNLRIRGFGLDFEAPYIAEEPDAGDS